MRHSTLILTLLMVACFGLAAGMNPWFEKWEGSRDRSGDMLTVALGDGRKLFARHVYAKADAYFHSGYYPSIFDYKEGFKQDNLSQKLGRETEAGAAENCATDFMGPPRDWIDGFSRHFIPSRHVHLGQEQSAHVHDEHCDHGAEAHVHDEHCDHGAEAHVHDEHCDHDQDHNSVHEEDPESKAAMKEILPWVRLSASLDPDHVDTYLIGAYWLRTEMRKPMEAGIFLREGLRALPLHPALLFELGRIHYEDEKDTGQARNLWELAMKQWRIRQEESREAELDNFLFEQIVGNLARLEEEEKQWSRALGYLEVLKSISPYPDHIQKWMQEIERQQP